MKIGVIGAGPSGLTTIKQLRDEGHEVVCFEKNDHVGGIWYRHEKDGDQMKVYDDMVLTISLKLMCYSDFMVKDRVFVNRQDYLRYLEAYADKFELTPHIRFGSTVEIVEKTEDGWAVTVTSGGSQTCHHFEALAICSGPFRTPRVAIPYLDKFTGEVIHSSRYRNNHKYRDKRVLVIGLAESGADIVRQISDVSASCTLSIRSHTFLLPRLFNGRDATDSYTVRAHHYEMCVRATEIPFRMKAFFEDDTMPRAAFLEAVRDVGVQSAMWKLAGSLSLESLGRDLASLGPSDSMLKALSQAAVDINEPSPEEIGTDIQPLNSMGQPLYPPKIDMYAEATPEAIDYINEWNRKSHHGVGSYSQKIITCKNVTFVPNILNGKIQVNDSGLDDIQGNTVYFKDHAIQEYDAIVLCTGFEQDFSFLRGVSIPGNNVRNLFKHSIHPDEGGKLAFMGFVRPYTGGIPICSEMQARYFALLCSGKVVLPKNVKELIDEDKIWEEEWTKFSPRHTEAIPSQILFLDSIAKEIGCLPTCEQLVGDPVLMGRMWFHTFNQSCYRLTGPHSMRDEATASILKEDLPGGRLTSLFAFMAASLLPPNSHPRDAVMYPSAGGGVAPF